MGKRDFRRELASFRCYDREAERVSERVGAPVVDCILQNREELIALCEWMEERRIRSYLEIGIWTGRLISALHSVFEFKIVAACDIFEAPTKFGLDVAVPPETELFVGDSTSHAYVDWRRQLGEIDLVFIDGDHSFEVVTRDFEINRPLPHRYLAFHDICGSNRWTVDVRRFWDGLTSGFKQEIVLPHVELGLPHSTMGIGIWSSDPDSRATSTIR
jgi:hypothetical protein